MALKYQYRLASFGAPAHVMVPHAPPQVPISASGIGAIDASGERVAVRFTASDTTAITHVDCLLRWVGDTSGKTFRLGVFGESSDRPNNADQKGGWTASFAGVAGGAGTLSWCGGTSGCKALGSSTGALTAGSKYWIVLDCDSGTCDGSNYVQQYRCGATWGPGDPYVSLYTGGSWSAPAPYAGMPFLTIDSDGYVAGLPLSINDAATYDVYGTRRAAIRFRTYSGITIQAITPYVASRSGLLANECFSLYEEDTYKGQLVAGPTSAVSVPQTLGTPITLSAGKTCYLVFAQQASAGDAAKYFRMSYRNLQHNDGRTAAVGDDLLWGTFTGHASNEQLDTPHSSFAAVDGAIPYLHPCWWLRADPDDQTVSAGGGPSVSGRLVL